MINRVAVAGLGKLGACLAAGFADAGLGDKHGLSVIGYDTDAAKVNAICSNQAPVQEPQLQEAIWRVNGRSQHLRRLWATTDPAEAVRASQACIFVMPTPSLANGSFDNTFLFDVISKIGAVVDTRPADALPYIFIVASTVTPGSCYSHLLPAIHKVCKRPFHLAYKPELIALGTVMHDLAEPDLALVGSDSLWAAAEVADLYRVLSRKCPIHCMSFVEAELAKISLNCAVTMRISFANQVAMVAERMGADAALILKAISDDRRIGKHAMKPGLSYGGPCVLPGTLVQTTNGLERIDTLEVDDRVLSHDGRYHAITTVHRRLYTGTLIKLTGEGFPGDPVITTPEHSIWFGRRLSESKARYRTANGKQRLTHMKALESLRFAPAADVEVGDVLALPRIQAEQLCPAFMNLRKNEVGRPSSAAGIHALDEDLLYTLGWYLAEGSSWQKEINLSFHRNEEGYVRQIAEIWEKHFRVSTKIKKRIGNGLNTRTICAPLARYLRETFGDYCYSKHIPAEWLNLPELHLKALLRGMWYGDGSNSDGQFSWATTSLELFNFMKLAFLRFGIAFTTKKPSAWTGRDGTKHRNAYFLCVRNPSVYPVMNELLPELQITPMGQGKQTVWFDGNAMLYHVKKVEQFPYDGEVFNLEVEEAESYVLEGGTVHNCFPRDNRMFQYVAKRVEVEPYLAMATDLVNDDIVKHILNQIAPIGDVGILGLAYKAGTVISEESAGMKILNALWQIKRVVKAHDPMMPETVSLETALRCHTVVVTTDAPEFRDLRFPSGTVLIDPFQVTRGVC